MLGEMLDKVESSEGENPELEVLKEIKNLMDTRLGDKLKGGMSVSKVEIEPIGEQKLEEAANPEGGAGLSPEEEEELNKLRGSMV